MVICYLVFLGQSSILFCRDPSSAVHSIISRNYLWSFITERRDVFSTIGDPTLQGQRFPISFQFDQKVTSCMRIHCIGFGYINILINYKSEKLNLSDLIGKKIINWGRALVNSWIIWKKPLRTVNVPLVINTQICI